jgi:hypothetical protein
MMKAVPLQNVGAGLVTLGTAGIGFITISGTELDAACEQLSELETIKV